MKTEDIKRMALAYQAVTEKKMDPVGQEDGDIDNDGDTDKSDKYLHNRRKVIKKAMSKNSNDPKAVKGETATMNPKLNNGKGATEQKESTEMSIREKLFSVIENRGEHYKSATAPETMDDKYKGAGAKKMKDDTKDDGSFQDLEKKGHDDASAAGRVTKASAPNPTDKNAKGDKTIINPVKDTTKVGKGDPSVKESFTKEVHSIAAAYQSMYEKKEKADTEKSAEENYAGNYGSSVASYGKEKDHEKRYEKENPGKKWKDLSWGHQQSHSANYNKNPA
jgi:hypothetical protein